MVSDKGQNRGRRFKTIAMAVRNRDAGRCQRCGTPETEEKLSVHHLISDVEVPKEVDAHLPVNLVTLCRRCHPHLESKSLHYQLKELNIENHTELMLSETERGGLNNQLESIGPDILSTKKISQEESEEFIEYSFGADSSQTDLFDF